jgi:hypothetical protein
MPPGASVFEKQRGGVSEVHHHHRIGNTGGGDVDTRLCDYQRSIGDHFLFLVQFDREDGVGSFFLGARMIGGLMAISQAAFVAAQLLFDLGRRVIQRDMRILRRSLRFQDQALHHLSDDIAGEGTCWSFAEGDVRGKGAVEIFVDDSAEPVGRMFLQGCARIHLVA